ncbi:CGNR zinc finger domain-containing protein [Thermostaphylospora chromogena]|uniref:Conserved protein containing a Zn-ribbon-like motif, possibly RNA-binding n=1 Tax=Thermostaphylospora chromogena TaxID=35622 RepID=A0A1H1FHA7_9ACTN|nr:CGNR zinc finger domain-containing protein [Thermostaphylospora chromogena]SDR00412.1 Conserved protein containing a Zn-ribbon-like motif, possibly RNA-binding [Thermostaphylospora chromogena]
MSTAAELVRDFVNTYDVEDDADELSSPAELTLWLRERGLAGPGDRADEDDLVLAVHLREELRAALRHNHDRIPANLSSGGEQTPYMEGPTLSATLEALPLRLAITGEGPELKPAVGGARGGLAAIAAAVMGAHADGMWRRLKVCAESTCQWAFIDSSKNRSRAWCSMRVCGNRTKTRAYRARRVVDASSRHS